MKLTAKALVGFGLLLALSCSRTTGENFVRESGISDLKKILGMTTEQLTKEFGEPIEFEKNIRPGRNRIVGTYYYTLRTTSSLSARMLKIELEAHRTVGYLYTSGFAEDSTRFLDDHIDHLRVGMTEQQVQAIVGDASGESTMPSLLIDAAILPTLQYKAKDRVKFAYYISYRLKDSRAVQFMQTLILVFDQKSHRLKDFVLTGKY